MPGFVASAASAADPWDAALLGLDAFLDKCCDPKYGRLVWQEGPTALGWHLAANRNLAAAVGAHLGRPSVKTVAVMGDGSFGMCVGELETAVRLKLPITFVVISNAVYGWIKAGQKSGYDKRYFSVDFGVTDHAKVAEAFGVKSWRVFEPGKLGSAFKEALAFGGPTLVDVVCQPLQDAKAPVSEWVA